jgi:hypothetical protein
VVELLRPQRGGFLRPFGCGWFIREYLLGKGPYGSGRIDPEMGAPQAQMFSHYKRALIRETALDRATRREERLAKREQRRINPDNIERLYNYYIARIPYRTTSCRYHSFVVYFSNLIRLQWVELTGSEEHSEFQDHYSKGEPRKYYRLTAAGRDAPDSAWANPFSALYGRTQTL